MLRFASFERESEGEVGMDQPANVSNFASLLVHGVAQSARVTAAYIASPFQSSPSSRAGVKAPPAAADGPKPTKAPPPRTPTAQESHEAKELAKIRSRGRWWIAGSVFAVVAFVLGSGIISIEFVDDDDDDEGAEEEEGEEEDGELEEILEESEEAVEEDRSDEAEREHLVFSMTDEQEEHIADEGFVEEDEVEEEIGLKNDMED